MPTEEAVEPYWQRFSRLKEAQGKSWSQLVRASKNVSLSTLRSFAIPPPDANGGPSRGRDRYPSADTIADVAKALNVAPEEFPEFRLAMARRALDERAPGNNLYSALEALEIFELGQRLRAERHVGPSTDRSQRERAAEDFEADAEEEARQRTARSSSDHEDERSEGDQEKRP